MQVAFSAISSGTERARLDAGQKSLLARARERPDLVKTVIDRARSQGIRSVRRDVQRKLAEETPAGYSCAGTVVEVGELVRGLSPGDRVACAGVGHANHAELVSVPTNLCAKVPEGVSLSAAALTTIAAIPMHGVRLADISLGERVAVVGCGLIGQIACRLATAAGAEVFAIDLDPAKVQAAVQGGADHAIVSDDAAAATVMDRTGGAGVDHVLVCAAAGTNAPLLLGASIARDRGSLILVGDVKIDMPRGPLFKKELRFMISRSYGPGRYDDEYEERGLDYPLAYVRWTEQRNMESVLDLQSRGKLRLDDLVEDATPVADAPRAYERLSLPPDQRPSGALLLSYSANGSAVLGPPAPLQAPPAPASAQAPRGSATARIGLIGPGGFAKAVLIPNLLKAGAQLELVAGGSGPSATAAARDHGFKAASDSPSALIASPDVDGVVVATRHADHAQLVTEALRGGKHVFCEKPLALDEDGLTEALDAAAASGRVLMVGFNRRFAPLVDELRTFLRPQTGPYVAIYRVSAGQVPPDSWVHDLTQGGGRILGEVCHFVDTLAAIVEQPVVGVHAFGWSLENLPVQAFDNVTVNLRFADSSVGSVVYSAVGSGQVGKERIEVSRGTATAVLDDFKSLSRFGGDGPGAGEAGTQDKGHAAELAAFVRGMRSGQMPVDLATVANVSLATFGIVESLRTGAVVTIGGQA